MARPGNGVDLDLGALVLAGGLGTRLRSVVAGRPKILAEVAGRPFLAYVLDGVAALGFDRVVLCTGYLGERVRDAFGERYGRLAIEYSQEAAPLGTAGALRLALPRLAARDAVVWNGDSYCDADVRALVAAHRASGAPATLLVARALDASRYGSVRFDGDGRVLAFEEKRAGARAAWVNAGVYVIARAVLLGVPPGREVSLEREVLPSWVGRGLRAHAADARFLDIGTPESYARAATFFRTRGW